MQVYLDAGSHVRLNDRPHYYCGIFTLYKLAYTLRADLANDNLKEAEDRFLDARKKLLDEGGGIVSIFYHPCEFVHKQFWDGVNFRKGANPPREQWKLPPAKTPEETRLAFQIFERYIQFIKRFPEVQFVTASEAALIYRDKAQSRRFSADEIKVAAKAAQSANDGVTFQERGDYTLSAAEVFSLLIDHMIRKVDDKEADKIGFPNSLYGPTGRVALMSRPVTTDWSQFTRTAADVAEYLQKQGRVPSTVWLGSVPVPPEAYLQALARVIIDLDHRAAHGVSGHPEKVEIQPAKLAVARYVADDGPNLWGWVIFPDGFRAPGMMALARQQAWTLKPALIDHTRQ
jgi:hypothetical protein